MGRGHLSFKHQSHQHSQEDVPLQINVIRANQSQLDPLLDLSGSYTCGAFSCHKSSEISTEAATLKMLATLSTLWNMTEGKC